MDPKWCGVGNSISLMLAGSTAPGLLGFAIDKYASAQCTGLIRMAIDLPP